MQRRFDFIRKRNIKFNQVLDLIGKIKMSKKKIAIITIAGIFGFLAACYIGIAIYFYQVFYPNTYINGGAVSDASPEEVKQALLDSMSDYQLKVVPVDGDPVLISGESIGFYYSFDQVDALKRRKWDGPGRLNFLPGQIIPLRRYIGGTL